MLRVMHVISSLNVGGAERMLYNLCCSDRCRAEHVVVSLTDLGYYGPLLRREGVRVYEINLTRNSFNVYAILKSLVFLKNQKSDVIIGWMYHGMLIALLLKALSFNKIPIIWNIRQSLDDMSMFRAKTRFIIYMLARFSSLAEVIVNNSTISIAQHISIGYSRNSFRYIPNGVDTQLYKPNRELRDKFRKKYDIDPHTFVVGFVGRNHKQKNFSFLVDGFNSSTYKDNALLFGVGAGLSKQVDLIDGKSILIDFLQNMHEIYNVFDVLCLPSRMEGFPNVLIESMATNIPCIATDVGANSNILNGTGWLIDRDNLPKLVDSIDDAYLNFINDGDTYKEDVRNSIKVNFDLTSIVDQYNQVILSLCK